MDFLTIVIAVVVGMWLYKLTEEIFYELKSYRRDRQFLRWKKACEENISKGKDVEKNKSTLEIVEKMIEEFHRNYMKRNQE